MFEVAMAVASISPIRSHRAAIRLMIGPRPGSPSLSLAVFNTHAFVKRLTAAGMPEAQAEALADELTPLIDDRLATKADLAELATKAELLATRADLKTEIAEAKTEIIKSMFGTIGFQTVIVLGAVVALARVVH
jgi:hypothetical protein